MKRLVSKAGIFEMVYFKKDIYLYIHIYQKNGGRGPLRLTNSLSRENPTLSLYSFSKWCSERQPIDRVVRRHNNEQFPIYKI